jgi:hypothetical protein
MRKLPLAAAVAAVLLAVPASAAAAPADGRVGPSLSITGNGRLLRPAGDMVTVGNFPMAGALTPDGRALHTAAAGPERLARGARARARRDACPTARG